MKKLLLFLIFMFLLLNCTENTYIITNKNIECSSLLYYYQTEDEVTIKKLQQRCIQLGFTHLGEIKIFKEDKKVIFMCCYDIE